MRNCLDLFSVPIGLRIRSSKICTACVERPCCCAEESLITFCSLKVLVAVNCRRGLLKLSSTVLFLTGRVCPQGWVLQGNSCFLIIDTPTVHRNEARKKCQQFGGDLAKITSATENQFIFDLLRKQNTITLYGVWLGLHRKADKTFYWADDAPLTGYTAWGATEPSGPNEKCGHMIGYGPRGGKWNDIRCTFPAAFHPSTAPVILCQKRA